MLYPKKDCFSCNQIVILLGISVGMAHGLPHLKNTTAAAQDSAATLSSDAFDKTGQDYESVSTPGNWPLIGPSIPHINEPSVFLGNGKRGYVPQEFVVVKGKKAAKYYTVPQENPQLGRPRVTEPEEPPQAKYTPQKFIIDKIDKGGKKTHLLPRATAEATETKGLQYPSQKFAIDQGGNELHHPPPQTKTTTSTLKPEYTPQKSVLDKSGGELHPLPRIEESNSRLAPRIDEIYNQTNAANALLTKRWQPMRDKKGKYMYVDDWTTVIDVINATPYRWHKGFISSYQMANWEEDWPEYIYPGETVRVVSFQRGGDWKRDSAAEITYHLEGVSRPMSFMLERRAGSRRHVYVTFRENLQTESNTKNKIQKLPCYDLEYHPYPGGSQFLLAGREDEFISMDPGFQWMQELYSEIKDSPLREIVMPRSHHTGMSKAAEGIGAVSKANTLTQTKTTIEQIGDYGVRVLDVRPVLFMGNYYEAHGTMVLGAWNGMLGENIKEMAKAIGKFHEKWPGELIIIDISAADSGRLEYGMQQMDEKDRKGLYKLFIDHAKPMKLPEHEDVTRWPLKKFIGGKKSATIIRVEDSWAKMPDFPGAEHGFVTSETFPLMHRWSDANKATKLAPDQIEYIRKERPNRNSRLFFSDWVVTQSTDEAIFPSKSITKMALPAYGALYHDLWNATTDLTYPNWIAMDHIHSTELVTFVKALNHCFVARKCGSLGGKVKGVDSEGEILENVHELDGKKRKGKKKKGKKE